MRILGLMPARGGSKGVPRKNVRELGRKPSMACSIDAAHEGTRIDRVVVRTEDRTSCFISVHRALRDHYGVDAFGGTVWGQDQAPFLDTGDVDYAPLPSFTRDVLEPTESTAADVGFLREREERCGVTMHRMIWSERNRLDGRRPRAFYERLCNQKVAVDHENLQHVADALAWGAVLQR